MRKIVLPFVALALVAGTSFASGSPATGADQYARLPIKMLDVRPPSERVRGVIGQMARRELACRAKPLAEVRRRIVNVAVQEWGFFKFPIVDYTEPENDVSPELVAFNPAYGGIAPVPPRWRGRFPALPTEEAVRVAASVAGYWAATPKGAEMIARQNRAWSGPWGIDGRWADPWSAAFISWVMCEAGLDDASQFQRAIAHWVYIDQAIAARDGRAARAAFVAHDLGEERITPGDLLCSSRRPAYRSIADRRRQRGVGARTHCDIVVRVDEAAARIYAIGGNVRRAVSLKLFPAVRGANRNLRPANISSDVDDERPMFAHLKLRAAAIEMSALDNSPTMKALDCELLFKERHPAYGMIPVSVPKAAC